MSTNAKPDKGRLNHNSPSTKIDDKLGAEVRSPRSKASAVNGVVAFLGGGGIQTSVNDLRASLRNCGQKAPAGVRTWPTARSVAPCPKSPLSSPNSRRSHRVLGNWSSRTVNGASGDAGPRVGKAILVKGSAAGGSKSAAVGESGSAVVSGSPTQRIVNGKQGISRSAAVAPGPGLASIECMGSSTLKKTAPPNHFFEVNQAIRQTSAPVWKQMPVAVAEVLVAALATGESYDPCLSRAVRCDSVKVCTV